MTVQLIGFSYQRPLQLHGLLTSVFRHWRRADEQLEVRIVVRAEPPYLDAYAEVQAEFPQVEWWPETDFCANVRDMVRPEVDYTLFACDDVVYVASLSEAEIDSAFEIAPAPLIGVSLRLGAHITQDMWGGALPRPAFLPVADDEPDWQYWDVTDRSSVGDWAYPWEVLGTVYPTDYVQEMIHAYDFATPSQLEAFGAARWVTCTSAEHMASFPSVRIVVPTVNMVQSEFPGNGIRTAAPLRPELLDDLWHQGIRLDVDLLAGASPPTWRIGEFPLRGV